MVEQLPLIPAADEQPSPGAAQLPELTPEATLQTTIKAFAGHMERVDFSENTIKSFLWDLSLLERYLDKRTPIGAIGTKELRDFMEYLRHGRGVPCTVKSYARRLTTLKVFFGWLAEESILPRDPAAPLIHEPATSPLPAILYDEQVERALEAAQALSHDAKSPDPRPLLLLNLILQTGMKKSECMALELRHFDFSDPQKPAVHIRYKSPRQFHKERKLALEPSFPSLFRRYLEAYKPRKALFPCTGRNLEYVLHKVAKLAGLEGGISFEMLRWTCAVREFKNGTEPDTLRRKLGLSEIAWEETLSKIQALAANPL